MTTISLLLENILKYFSRHSTHFIIDDVEILVLPDLTDLIDLSSRRPNYTNSVKLDYNATEETGANVIFENAVITREFCFETSLESRGDFSRRASSLKEARQKQPSRFVDPVVAVIAARSRFRNIELVEGMYSSWNRGRFFNSARRVKESRVISSFLELFGSSRSREKRESRRGNCLRRVNSR